MFSWFDIMTFWLGRLETHPQSVVSGGQCCHLTNPAWMMNRVYDWMGHSPPSNVLYYITSVQFCAWPRYRATQEFGHGINYLAYGHVGRLAFDMVDNGGIKIGRLLFMKGCGLVRLEFSCNFNNMGLFIWFWIVAVLTCHLWFVVHWRRVLSI